MDRRVDFIVNVIKATDLPSNFCKDVFVEYQVYLEDTKYHTHVIPDKNRNPVFDFKKQHT